MKVLVTGANGYIGRHVVNELGKHNDIYVLANDVNIEGMDSFAEKSNINIFDEENVFEALGGPDVCIHLAWRNGFAHNSDSHMLDLSKHYNFIKKMIDGGLKHIVVMGSMHEIGYYEGAIDEDTPCNPMSKYAIAKDSLRRSVELLTKEKDVTFQWLRGFYIVGDDERSNSIFSKLIKAEKEGNKKFPFTSGKNKYDFIDIDFFAKQIVEAALQEEVNGIINCCSGIPVSLADKVEKFIADNNYHIKLEYGAFPDRPYDSPAIWGDNAKIKKILEKNEENK